ncbi:MAG: fasciclin domain-containing protein [Ferruginibacter sp.]|nr:fasciclin domain-containing protein [Ferruginibacter sp.]
MKTLINKYKKGLLPIVAAAILFASCNKDVNQFPIPAIAANGTISLDSILKTTPNDSLYYLLIRRASLGPTNFVNLLRATTVTNQYTLFVPDNNGMKAFINAISGGLVPLAAPDAVFAGFISANIPVASAVGLVSYNIIPQRYDTASIPSVFPNFPVGTSIFPSPTAPFLTFRTFPSKRPGILRVNTLPMTTPLNVNALNGVIHHVASLIAPPAPSFLWNRIDTDVTPGTGLTYLKAAILRADSGSAAPGTLFSALNNPAANLTVFAPTDAVFQGTLTALITQGLIAQGVPPATAAAQAAFLASTPGVFTNPLLFGTLSATTVRGIVVYHLFSNTAFTSNFPVTATRYPTLLNTAIAAHPGVELAATFTGAFASTATVKGLGNATAASIFINGTPAPNGASDQFYINGTLHKINQVLLPQ